MARARTMGRLIDVELEGMPEQGHRMIGLVEGIVSTIEGCKGASVRLTLECPWVVLLLGEARRRPAHEVLEGIRDPSLRLGVSAGQTPKNMQGGEGLTAERGSQHFFSSDPQNSAEEAPANDSGRG